MAASKKTSSIFYIAVAFVLGVAVALVLVRYLAPELSLDRGTDGDIRDVVVIDNIPLPPEVSTVPDIPVATAKYRLAIVIDDMGRTVGSLDDIIALEVPITIAVLPHLGRSTKVALKAREHGLDVLLHMPMEPINSNVNDPGDGAVFTSMSNDEVRETLLKALKSVPNIVGLNNHMGSKFTEDSVKMKVVLEELKLRELFFLDSKTTAKSVGVDVARELEVKTTARDIFLDNEQDQTYIEGQFRKALALAKRKGEGVAIGHPYPETILAIKNVMAEEGSEGVTIVSISELIY